MQLKFAGIGPLARARIQTLQDRLRRTTRRERFLLGGLVMAALIMAPLAIMDWRNTQQDRYIDALAERSAAKLSRDSARRITASTPDRAALDDMRGWGFNATNLDVARVQIEQRIFEQAEQAGMGDVQITTNEEIETTGPVQWLGAEVEADLKWVPTFAFLDGLTAWPEGFRLTRFQFETTTSDVPADVSFAPVSTGRIRIGVAFPVQLIEAEAVP